MKNIGAISLPPRPKPGMDVLSWSTKVNQCLQQLRDRAVNGKKGKKSKGTDAKPPLWITLSMKPDGSGDKQIIVKFGHVVPRHNASGEAGEPIEITGLPPKDTPATAALDDKFWVKLTIDEYGKCTAADWETGTAWPEDVPPELIGGDDQTGAAGERYIRIGEIIEDPDSTSTPPRTIVKQLHTGHIDYSQPELIENTTLSPSTNEARVLKVWNSSAGRWDLRYLEAGDGIEIEELTDSIKVKMAAEYLTALSHPWKATNLGTEFIEIAPGKIMGIRDAGTPGDYPWNFRYVSYAGGTVEVTSATGWIYAIVPVTQRSVFEDGAINTITASQDPDSVTVVFDTADPDTVAVASIMEICIPIAEVALASSIATVVDQVLTHNPMLTIEVAVSMP